MQRGQHEAVATQRDQDVGVFGGVLPMALDERFQCALRLVEYRFLVIDHAVEIYGAIVAAIFAAVGIWLGHRLTRSKVVVREVPRP